MTIRSFEYATQVRILAAAIFAIYQAWFRFGTGIQKPRNDLESTNTPFLTTRYSSSMSAGRLSWWNTSMLVFPYDMISCSRADSGKSVFLPGSVKLTRPGIHAMSSPLCASYSYRVMFMSAQIYLSIELGCVDKGVKRSREYKAISKCRRVPSKMESAETRSLPYWTASQLAKILAALTDLTGRLYLWRLQLVV